MVDKPNDQVNMIPLVDDQDTNIVSEDEVVETQGPKKKAKAKRKRRLASDVWKSFKILPKPGDDGKQRCKCKTCGVTYICDSNYGTGNMLRHAEKCVRRDTRNVGQLLITRNMSLESQNFDNEKFRELLNAAIVMHDLPFQFVEYEGIRAVFTYLCLEVQVISRNTSRSDIMKMYKKEKERIKFRLGPVPGRICFTSDLWTSYITDGYLSLTAHFVDDNWVLQKRVLNIRSSLICNGEYFHVRCCCHIINLIVQDGLKVIDGSVNKIRECIKRLRGSQSRKIKFHECVKVMAIEGKKGLKQDVPTRWNSTFLMLDSALYYRQAFLHLELSDSNFTYCPSTGSTYPTSNLYFPVVAIAHLTIKEKLTSDDNFIKDMASKMYEKFIKYWADFSDILAIACILDPQYKIQFVEFFYKKIYGIASQQFLTVKEKLFALFDEYVNERSTLAEKSTSKSSSSKLATENVTSLNFLYPNEGGEVMKEFDTFENNVLSVQKTQLEMYLEEQRIDRKAEIDVLAYGKVNHLRYTELAAMARDIPSIPISTVASESAFSIGGRIINKYRSSLKPETAEALVCTRDWLYREKKSVEKELKIEDILEDIMNLKIE